MKKFWGLSTVMLGVMVSVLQISAGEKQRTADEILEKVDNLLNAPRDQDLSIKLILTDKDGRERIRTMRMLQKGSDKRMIRFLSPADQRGIAFLSLPDDVMHLYLPAFKKTRRIASHVKNRRFAGTDFTYEDLEAKRYSEKYVPKLLGTKTRECLILEKDGEKTEWVAKEIDHYLLQLNPREDVRTDYSKLIAWIRTDNFYPTKIEFYDKGNELYKVLIAEKIKKVDGYWVAMETTMENLEREHKTTMIIEEVKFDSGLSKDKFTKRYLSR